MQYTESLFPPQVLKAVSKLHYYIFPVCLLQRNHQLNPFDRITGIISYCIASTKGEHQLDSFLRSYLRTAENHIEQWEAEHGRDQKVKITQKAFNLFRPNADRRGQYTKFVCLCAARACLGKRQMQGILRERILYVSQGYRSRALYRQYESTIPKSEKRCKKTVTRVTRWLAEKGFLARITYNRRQTFYSTRQTFAQLKEAVSTLKERLFQKRNNQLYRDQLPLSVSSGFAPVQPAGTPKPLADIELQCVDREYQAYSFPALRRALSQSDIEAFYCELESGSGIYVDLSAYERFRKNRSTVIAIKALQRE